MADVSVRFQVAGDSEIVLNLATAEAVRLVEAIMRKVAESMTAPQRPTIGTTWPDAPQGNPGMPPGR